VFIYVFNSCSVLFTVTLVITENVGLVKNVTVKLPYYNPFYDNYENPSPIQIQYIHLYRVWKLGKESPCNRESQRLCFLNLFEYFTV
jgi:hypothetical protein